jgi:asparagine synthase (glutamine-hydrolysing)
MARDEATGDWLAACGSWFHTTGWVSGEEAKLLACARDAGVRRLADELEGFFLLAYGRAAAREVVLITDLMGSRHGFIRDFGDCLAISTSSLLLASLGESPLDPIGCEEFLRLGVIYEARTLFRDVRKLAPATIYRFVDGRQVEASRYWRLGDLDPGALDGDRAIEQLSERLVTAAKRIGRLYPRPVCDLTAGYDSRAVVSAMKSAGVDFATTVSGPPESPDVVIAEHLSRITRAPHTHIEPDPHVTWDRLNDALRVTDGECDLFEYARIQAIHHRLSQHHDAGINGSYGEIARGYWWELLRPRVGRRQPLDTRALAAKRYAIGAGTTTLFSAGLDLTAHLAAIIERCNQDLVGWPNTAQMDHAYLTLRMQRWQGRIASSTDQLWPCLSLFLFRSVMETALQTVPRARLHSRLARRVMATLQPALAAHPLESGAPAMPLTLTTWPRFLPALAHLAGKARRKLFRPVVSHGLKPARLGLNEDDARAVLDPARMRLTALIEPARLRAFLDSLPAGRHLANGQWRRLLSLELALHVLDSSGS